VFLFIVDATISCGKAVKKFLLTHKEVFSILNYLKNNLLSMIVLGFSKEIMANYGYQTLGTELSIDLFDKAHFF
jgi:hypothetical protein